MIDVLHDLSIRLFQLQYFAVKTLNFICFKHFVAL
jgi:hypothetical protein